MTHHIPLTSHPAQYAPAFRHLLMTTPHWLMAQDRALDKTDIYTSTTYSSHTLTREVAAIVQALMHVNWSMPRVGVDSTVRGSYQ